MDKENKKFKNVSSTRAQHLIAADTESVFNSTLKSPSDLIPKDADLSCISSISGCTNYMDFNNEVLITAANYKTPDLNDKIASSLSDINVKQLELDNLSIQYLIVSVMKANVSKWFKEEEDSAMNLIFEVHRAHETLKKNCFELEYEEKLIDNLLELVEFMDKFNIWIENNLDKLSEFKNSYDKLAEMCSKAKNYLEIKNIHIPSNQDFEKSLKTELKNTCLILDKVNNCCSTKNLITAPDSQMDEKIDYNLIEELINQYNKIKDCIIQYNGLNCI